MAEVMKEAIKEYEKERIEIRGQMDYLKNSYGKIVENRASAMRGWMEIAECSEELFKIRK